MKSDFEVDFPGWTPTCLQCFFKAPQPNGTPQECHQNGSGSPSNRCAETKEIYVHNIVVRRAFMIQFGHVGHHVDFSGVCKFFAMKYPFSLPENSFRKKTLPKAPNSIELMLPLEKRPNLDTLFEANFKFCLHNMQSKLFVSQGIFESSGQEQRKLWLTSTLQNVHLFLKQLADFGFGSPSPKILYVFLRLLRLHREIPNTCRDVKYHLSECQLTECSQQCGGKHQFQRRDRCLPHFLQID